jgi:hypothetical protein
MDGISPLRYAAWQENLESSLRGRPPISHTPVGLWKSKRGWIMGSENKNHESGGLTPSLADRDALGVGADQVVDHDPPLVKRYYEGDPAAGEQPGFQMTDAERKASAQDRARMKPQPKSESNKQGGEMSQYSKQKKEEYDLQKK